MGKYNVPVCIVLLMQILNGISTNKNIVTNAGGFKAGLYPSTQLDTGTWVGSSGYITCTETCRARQFTQWSDRKLKKDIEMIDEKKAIEFVKGINPVSYRFKKNHHQRIHMGFIAQEVAETAKDIYGDLALYEAKKKNAEIEDTDFDPNTPDEELEWSLAYTEFIAPLYKVVQYQQKEIERLENILNILQEKV